MSSRKMVTNVHLFTNLVTMEELCGSGLAAQLNEITEYPYRGMASFHHLLEEWDSSAVRGMKEAEAAHTVVNTILVLEDDFLGIDQEEMKLLVYAAKMTYPSHLATIVCLTSSTSSTVKDFYDLLKLGVKEVLNKSESRSVTQCMRKYLMEREMEEVQSQLTRKILTIAENNDFVVVKGGLVRYSIFERMYNNSYVAFKETGSGMELFDTAPNFFALLLKVKKSAGILGDLDIGYFHITLRE
jgi:hypothetical protein